MTKKTFEDAGAKMKTVAEMEVGDIFVHITGEAYIKTNMPTSNAGRETIFCVRLNDGHVSTFVSETKYRVIETMKFEYK